MHLVFLTLPLPRYPALSVAVSVILWGRNVARNQLPSVVLRWPVLRLPIPELERYKSSLELQSTSATLNVPAPQIVLIKLYNTVERYHCVSSEPPTLEAGVCDPCSPSEHTRLSQSTLGRWSPAKKLKREVICMMSREPLICLTWTLMMITQSSPSTQPRRVTSHTSSITRYVYGSRLAL